MQIEIISNIYYKYLNNLDKCRICASRTHTAINICTIIVQVH